MHIINVAIPATSNEMEYNLTEVSMGCASDYRRLSLMTVEQDYLLTDSAMSTRYPRRKMLRTKKFGIADKFGCKQALKMRNVF